MDPTFPSKNSKKSSDPSSQLELGTSADTITGTLERVTYHNNDNGFSVLQLKIRGERNLTTVIGSIASPQPGELIEAVGQWVVNKDYGRQFKAQEMKSVPPTTLEGIAKYLGSGLIRGVGPGYAQKLVDKFGEDVFNVIENSPHRLNQIPRLGQARIKTIVQSWKDQKFIRTIMVFLQTHGVSPSRAVRIYRTYGDNAIEIVRKNPYCLAKDIQGIGFKTADQIAISLGIPADSLFRARAGLSFTLNQALSQGNCALPENLLIRQTEELLQIDEARLREALHLEYSEGTLIQEKLENEHWTYLSVIHKLENEVAGNLKPDPNFKHRKRANPPETLKELEAAQKVLGVELAPLQKEAVQMALEKQISVVTGGPGTGKSTLTKVLTKILKDRGLNIVLCSPTGRAAKRLTECTGMEAKTVHRTLGIDPKSGGFSFNESNKLLADVIIVDEASMLDIFLMAALLRALPMTGSLLLIGDKDQLPSVGPGRVLADILESERIPFVRLNQIFRQASQSQIITAAHAINQGEVPPMENSPHSDFFFFEINEANPGVDLVLDLVTERIPKKFGFKPKDVQVLSPMQKGDMGVRNLNEQLQKVINPTPKSKIEKYGVSFGLGDKVIVTKNDYEKDVFNGDIGIVHELDDELQECTLMIDDREVIFSYDDLDIVQQAYALTVHKSQGSEYPVVVIPVTTQHFVMLKRNLIYTAVTRGKKLVVLVGQKRALKMAVEKVESSTRYTLLASKIRKNSL